MDSDLTYLCHIRDAIEKIERYIAQTDYEAFCTNDMMIHEYFGVVLKVVWDTCQSNLPILKGFIQRVLADQP